MRIQIKTEEELFYYFNKGYKEVWITEQGSYAELHLEGKKKVTSYIWNKQEQRVSYRDGYRLYDAFHNEDPKDKVYVDISAHEYIERLSIEDNKGS